MGPVTSTEVKPRYDRSYRPAVAPVTCNQPEPADLGIGLLAFGAVACVSVPVEDASAGITLGDFLHRLGKRLPLLDSGPVFGQSPNSVVVVSVAGYASQSNRRSPFDSRPFRFRI